MDTSVWAELLHLSRFEVIDSFSQVGVPLHLGSATADEARSEAAALQGQEGQG
jgi:hypothetical protein